MEGKRKMQKQIVNKKELAIILNYIKDDLDALHKKTDIIEKQMNILLELLTTFVKIEREKGKNNG